MNSTYIHRLLNGIPAVKGGKEDTYQRYVRKSCDKCKLSCYVPIKLITCTCKGTLRNVE